jgi:hypothetical protein
VNAGGGHGSRLSLPGIHVACGAQDVDGRDKPGHDANLVSVRAETKVYTRIGIST